MMENFELIFLGTGAADWPFHPAGDMKYDQSGAIRRTSSLLIDRTYLIDPAPEAFFFASEVLKLDLTGLKGVFITHTHSDHYNHDCFMQFVNASKETVVLYCHETALPGLDLTEEDRKKIQVHPLTVGKSEELGCETVLPLAANHIVEETNETTLHYIFQKGFKKFLYGCDGGWYLDKTWCVIRETCLDAVIFDGTVGAGRNDWRIGGHNSMEMVAILTDCMKNAGTLKEGSRVILSHLAKTLHRPDEDYGDWTVAQDGMKLEI